jgi:hypothetical protein
MSDQWSVRVTAPVSADLDVDAQAVVAEKLRATITHDGARHLLTADYRVTAPTLRQATDEALRAARALPAKPTRLRVLPLDDWMAEQKAPQPRDLVGAAEAAILLGVSRQRVGQLAERPDFPAPIARLSAGPVWTHTSIEAFNQSWSRKITGRPRKAAPA